MIYGFLNKFGRNTPSFLSGHLVRIPLKYRHGRAYTEFKELIQISKNWSKDEIKEYVVERFDGVFQHAKKFNLYKRKYEEANVIDLKVKCICDIQKTPILTRSEIRENINEFMGHILRRPVELVEIHCTYTIFKVVAKIRFYTR